ncbi:toll/interleukin-1 receptor domain-containing protein [Mesorhizobium sp. M0983]|uniref:toll/interleukin-1 receptor domain-containing protein n=1 Tax=unclassified Mesorhizobium TaxID=325217 RepID=UPI0033353364
MNAIRGNIFLSHASEDKEFVRTIYDRLDAAGVFYDVRSIDAGEKTIEAMESGIEKSAVFVFFHSPHSNKPWVNFEQDLARIHSIIKTGVKILVCPLYEESYKTLPLWMQQYMTTTPAYRASDIVRTIIHLQTMSIREQKDAREIFVGREALLRRVELELLSAPSRIGTPVQHIILSGLPGMGRTTFATSVVESSFSAMRPAGPAFDLPDMADAVDLYLRLKEDLDGAMSKEEIERQIAAFQGLDVDRQVELILKALSHWADLNQVVVLKTRWGLRDRSRQLKPWISTLFKSSQAVRNLRIIYISERRLPPEETAQFLNVMQFEVAELTDEDIQYILSKKTDRRFFDANLSAYIATKIRGHPATAHYVSFLTNGGMSFDTINSNPTPIYAFQDRTLESIFQSKSLTVLQESLLEVLGWFPRLPFSVLEKVFNDTNRSNLTQEIWGLLDYSLVILGDGGYYRVPEVVSSRIKRLPGLRATEIFKNVRDIIQEQVKEGVLESELIDALIISVVETGGDLPKELKGILTSASLLSLVQEQFLAVRAMKGKNQEKYIRIYNLSKLAFVMKASDDAVEQILFTGGDAAIRGGQYPDDIIDFMSKKALPSVYYLIGSYAFYSEKNYDKAVVNLEKALKLKHFRVRNTRLLAKSYIRRQSFHEAYEVLGRLPEAQLFRDSSLLVLKIRALRGMRLNKEAEELEAQLQKVSDEFGNVALYLAGRSLREGRFDTALKHLEKARESPRVNQLSIALFECAISIERGDASSLPQTVELAISAGRQFDAWQLQARMALSEGDWKTALALISQISRKDYFDLALEQRALNSKKASEEVTRDAAALADIDRRLLEIMVLSVKVPEGFRDA